MPVFGGDTGNGFALFLAAMHDTSDPAANLEILVSCPSVTPAEGGALEALAAMLVPLGFTVDRVEVFRRRHARRREPLRAARHRRPAPDVRRAYRRRAARRRGSVDASALCRRDRRRRAVRPRRRRHEGRHRLLRRGACAGISNGTARPTGSVSLLITGDEEGPAINGTVKLLEWAAARGERWDAGDRRRADQSRPRWAT